MQPMNADGINIDRDILIATLNNFVSQARIKEVQMEAAIQQLMQRNLHLEQSLAKYDMEITDEEAINDEEDVG